MPDKYIIKNFSCELLQKIMDRQLKAREYYEKQDDSEDPFNPLAFVMFFHSSVLSFLSDFSGSWDDYMGDDIKFNAKLYEYYCLGRHYGTMNTFFYFPFLLTFSGRYHELLLRTTSGHNPTSNPTEHRPRNPLQL